MSTARQDKIQQHYDEVADIYDNHYDLPHGRCYHTHLSQHLMQSLQKARDSLTSGAGPGFLSKNTRVKRAVQWGLI